MNSSCALDVTPAGVGILTLDQPGSKVNVLTRELWADLESAVDEARSRPLAGLVIASAKPSVFIAGADLKLLETATGPNDPAVRSFIEHGLRVLEKLESLPFPTCAAIGGAALGGGLEVALACDIRLVSNGPKVQLGLPEVKLGLIPGWGGTQRLPRVVGAISALEIMFNNLQLDAETARYRGLVTEVAPSENLRTEAVKLLKRSRLHGEWKSVRENKRKPMEVASKGPTLEDLKAGHFSDAQINAMSLNPETMTAYRQYASEQMKDLLRRPATIALLDVVEQGCALPLQEAISIETRAFMRLVGTPESRQLISEFFASRKR